jgi:hypothetical protein
MENQGWLLALPPPTYLEIVNRGIAALSERKTDPFHDEIKIASRSQCGMGRPFRCVVALDA